MTSTHEKHEVIGEVVAVSGTGKSVKISGEKEWVFIPSRDFGGNAPIPKRGETWRIVWELGYRVSTDDYGRFARQMEFISAATDKQPQCSQLVLDPDRPAFEDGECFYQIKDARNETFKETYDWYIQTEAWARKRRQRLELDEHRCQAYLPVCLSKATEVHHIRYDHLGNEPMIDLVSVCGPCHEQITSMDRSRRKRS